MKVKAIKDQAYVEAGNVLIKYPFRNINSALEALSHRYDTALVKEEVEINCNDVMRYYPLPAGCRKVKAVYIGNIPSRHYRVNFLEGIRFDEMGKHRVICLRSPKKVSNTEEVPEIHPDYHWTLAKYMAARHLERLRPDRSRELMSEFWSDCVAIDRRLRHMGSDHNRPRPAPQFR